MEGKLGNTDTKICPGRKTSPWISSLPMIKGAIKPYGAGIVELSMKAPTSVSKPADLGQGVPNCASKANGNRSRGHGVLPRFGPYLWR